MKVLSLFDGIGGARQALKNLNIDCEYYASEIDKFVIEVAKHNHPDIKHIGSVTGIATEEGWIFYNQDNDPMKNGGSFKGNIDLLIGGSPCQDLSCAKRDGKGLKGERSGLFFEYVRILNQVKPKYFVLENVASMKKESRDEITKNLFGIEPIKIDSALVTAQQRKRYYWVGKLQEDGNYKKVEIEQPEDKEIFLKDIIESGDTEKLKSYCITATYSRACPRDYLNHAQRQMIWKGAALRGRFILNGKRKDIKGAKTEQRLEIRNDNKVNCLTSVSKDSLVLMKDLLRRLTHIECERLQGFSDNYTQLIKSSAGRYKALGNSFTVPVIEHILKAIVSK